VADSSARSVGYLMWGPVRASPSDAPTPRASHGRAANRLRCSPTSDFRLRSVPAIEAEVEIGPPHWPQPILYIHEHDESGLFLSENGQFLNDHIGIRPVHGTFRYSGDLADHIHSFDALAEDGVPVT